MTNSRLEKLKQKQQALENKQRRERAQIAAQIKDAEAKAAEQERKNETRRKIIDGALIREHAAKNPDCEAAQVLSRLRNEYVTRPTERKLMGLPPLPKPKSDNDNANAELKPQFDQVDNTSTT